MPSSSDQFTELVTYLPINVQTYLLFQTTPAPESAETSGSAAQASPGILSRNPPRLPPHMSVFAAEEPRILLVDQEGLHNFFEKLVILAAAYFVAISLNTIQWMYRLLFISH